jgi:phospholipid/cholesterol/gamma-HCH transport system ATP-binding protein
LSSPDANEQSAIIKIRGLSTHLNSQEVLKHVDLDIYQHEIFGIVGNSGCGKTTLLRSILMLQKPTSGSISLFGQNTDQLSERQMSQIQRRWGVLFQQSALFSSLTVLENVLFPLRTLTHLDVKLQKEIAYLKIVLTGLPISAADKYPSELSGGMQKRAALARAIVLDPELLLLDEPTSGLDPHSAHELDRLILDLRNVLNLTIILVTHDLDTLWKVTDRVAFMEEGTILAAEPMQELVRLDHPAIKEYFSGSRGQRANDAKTQREDRER